MYCGEEIFSGFVVSCGDSAELFEFEEEIFDQVALFIDFLIVVALVGAVRFGRDDGLDGLALQEVQHTLIRIVGFVSQKIVRFEARQQRIRSL